MLIRVDDQLAPRDSAAFEEGLQNIATASHQGVHLLTGSHRTLTALSRVKALSRLARAALLTAASTSSETRALVTKLPAHILVVDGATCIQEHRLWRVGIEWFRSNETTQATRLFAESMDDVLLYEFLAEAGSIDGCRSKFNRQPAGGSNFGRNWALAAEGSPAIAVVDSDKHCSNVALGRTAQGVLTADAQMGRSPRHIHVLEVREAENLLSETMVLRCSNGDVAARAKAAIDSNSVGSKHGYADLKEEVNRTLLGNAVACLSNMSSRERKLCLLNSPGAPGPALPELLAAWGIAGKKTRS